MRYLVCRGETVGSRLSGFLVCDAKKKFRIVSMHEKECNARIKARELEDGALLRHQRKYHQRITVRRQSCHKVK